MDPRTLCSSLLFVNVILSLTLHHVSCMSQNTLSSWHTSPKKKKKDSDFAGDLEDSKSTSGGILCIIGSHTFVTIPSNVQFSHQEPVLYVFEDNEAVIKMIIKGRSPTMRHVSRTHGVALDWLFVRINLDSKIQIKYIDTRNQLADILTKGSFTRDEWNHLLCLFNINHFSSTVCSDTMAKRSQ